MSRTKRPEEKVKVISISIPHDLYERISLAANGNSRSKLITDILLKHYPKETP